VPLLSVVVLWLPGQPHEAGSMRLAIGWTHEAGDPPHPILRGGSMTLAIRWLHDGGETAGTWLHEADDWHSGSWSSADRLGVLRGRDAHSW